MGIAVWKVIAAAKTKPFGFQAFYPATASAATAFPSTHRQRHHDLQMKSVSLTPANMRKYDLVLIATDHSQYDWPMICRHSRLIVDTRNATASVKGPKKRVILA